MRGFVVLHFPQDGTAYAKQQQISNQEYLERLGAAAVGRGDTFKLHNDVADTANKFVQNGVHEGVNSIMADKLSVQGVSSMVVEQLIKITIWLLQKKMLDDSSRIYNSSEKTANNAFEAEILKKGGSCGHTIPSSEAAREGLHRPYWFGNRNA
jgi:hypothetical protein